MKKFTVLGLLIVLALCLVIGITDISSSAAKGHGMPQSQGPKPNTNARSAGRPHAVQPNAAKLQGGALPTFTATDVESYIQKSGRFKDVRGKVLPHTITFLSSQELGKKLHEDLSTETSVLCYVEFQGSSPWASASASGPPIINKKGTPIANVPTFTKTYIVFDGKTGDEIEWGGKP